MAEEHPFLWLSNILLLNLKLQYFGHLMWRADSLEKTLMLGETEGRRRRGDSWWDGWMASPTWWMWVWASSRSWWWTGKPGVLQSLGHKELDMTKRRNWTELNWYRHIYGQLIYDRVSKGETRVSSIKGVKRTGQPHTKSEARHLSYTTHKNYLNMG